MLSLVGKLTFRFMHWSLQENAKVVSIDGFEDVPENDEKSLQKAVAHQPVSVAIEAGGREFQLYKAVKPAAVSSICYGPARFGCCSYTRLSVFIHLGCLYWNLHHES